MWSVLKNAPCALRTSVSPYWGPASVLTEDQSQALEDQGQGLRGPGSGLTEDQSQSLSRTRVRPYRGWESVLTEDQGLALLRTRVRSYWGENQSLLSTTARPYWGPHSSFSSVQMRLYWVLDWVKPDSVPHQASWVLSKAWLWSTWYPLCAVTQAWFSSSLKLLSVQNSPLTVVHTHAWLWPSLSPDSIHHWRPALVLTNSFHLVVANTWLWTSL